MGGFDPVVLKVIFLLFSLTTLAYGQQEAALECPLPAGPSTNNAATCAQYPACVFENNFCHMQANGIAGYKVVSAPVDTGRGFTVDLKLYDSSVTLFDADIVDLVFEAIYHEDYHLQIKIYDPNNNRYEVPFPLNLPLVAGSSPLYSVTVSAVGTPFTFSVQRVSTGTTIFNTVGPLSFEDQFLQIATSLPSEFLYGLGENSHSTFKHYFGTRVTQPIFARDQPVSTGEFNQYGTQPYYVNIEDAAGNTHSVLLYSSNAMEYSTFSLSDIAVEPAIAFKTIGGILDLHFFLGPTPEDVNVQYVTAVGMAEFPPYWALGFHLSRYGYNTLAALQTVVARNQAAGIPLDVQTCDIDYMQDQRDFTYNQVDWNGFPAFIDSLHADGIRVTLILDPAVVIDFATYPPGANGRDQDVYVKWLSPGLIPADQEPTAADYMIGYVWPDYKVAFPDFFKPAAKDWWSAECQTLHNTLSFDALWIDMNEPANFGTNNDRPFNYPTALPDWSLKCPYNSWDSPPFPTKATYMNLNSNNPKRLSDKTICMSGLQTDGINNYVHYDVHNMYGITETVATYDALEDLFPGKRHLVLSRSTFPGSGKYAAHWLGDNTANFEQLKMSVIGLMEFNLFGIPNAGADVCGFFGDSTPELCARWMELGAFYPFDRNHNTLGAADQDPAATTRGAAWTPVTDISRKYLLLRYKYLPYLYLLFHNANMLGNSVVRPLFNLFPTDVNVRGIDDQFLWGNMLMIAPVLVDQARTRDVYFPQGLWYDFEVGTLASDVSGTQSVNAPLDIIPLYILGGSIMPYQEPAVTTTLSRLNPFGLTIALDVSLTASGDIFWDDGESIHDMMTSYMSHINFAGNVLSMTVERGETVVTGLNLETAVFYGYPNNPMSIDVDSTPLDPADWTFDANNVLTVSFSVPLGLDFTMTLA